MFVLFFEIGKNLTPQKKKNCKGTFFFFFTVTVLSKEGNIPPLLPFNPIVVVPYCWCGLDSNLLATIGSLIILFYFKKLASEIGLVPAKNQVSFRNLLSQSIFTWILSVLLTWKYVSFFNFWVYLFCNGYEQLLILAIRPEVEYGYKRNNSREEGKKKNTKVWWVNWYRGSLNNGLF